MPASASRIGLSGLQAVLDVPVRRLDRAFELFAEAVTEPALASDDVARHVQLRLAEIEQGRANSASRATTEFRRAVFTPDSRAARMNGGEPETVSAVHRGRRRGVSRRPLRPGRGRP